MASERKRDFYKTAITKSSRFIESVPDEVTEEAVSTQYDHCVESWRMFQETHLEILLVTGDEFVGFQNAEFDAVESIAMQIIPRFKALLKKFDTKDDEYESAHSTQADNVTNRTHGGLRVPYFKIPLFAGDYDAWPAFKDLFRSMIHSNNNMSNVQRLGYLKVNLGGEALKIVKNLEITDANYQTAWGLLTDRYDNERILVNRWISLIFKIPTSRGNSADIKTILDGTQEALQGLRNLNRPVDNYDDFLVYLTETKLDPNSKQKWEDDIGGLQNATPTWDQMVAFLKTRFRALEAAGDKSSQFNQSNRDNQLKSTSPLKSSTNESQSKSDSNDSCLFCKKKHRLSSCFLFQKKPLQERQTLVDNNKLCPNCLSIGHKAEMCLSTYTCRICQQRHHTLLHVTKQTSNVTSDSKSEVDEQNNCCMTLLATALVNTSTATGVKVQLRALIDQGSQVSFIRTRVAHRLGLSTISGTTDFISTKGITQLTFTSSYDPNATFQVVVTVLDRITGQLPSELVHLDLPDTWKQLPLADPKFREPQPIDILLGADVVSEILRDAQCGIF